MHKKSFPWSNFYYSGITDGLDASFNIDFTHDYLKTINKKGCISGKLPQYVKTDSQDFKINVNQTKYLNSKDKLINMLDNYLKLKKQIYTYFGYKEQQRSFPIEDCRSAYWNIYGTESSGIVIYAPILKDLESGEGSCRSGDIYTQKHLDKWVYRANKYTMILIASSCKLDIFLTIFSNDKEIVGLK